MTTPTIEFWNWFAENKDHFRTFDADRQELIDEISQRLKAIDERLTWEISPEHEGMCGLVISADGRRAVFPIVRAVVAAAPELPGWQVRAFRQRVDLGQFTLEFAGREITTGDFYFQLSRQGSSLDLAYYLPGLTAENRDVLMHISFILLDMALGEEDVALGIRYIDHHPVPADPAAEGLHPLTELPAAFDALRSSSR